MTARAVFPLLAGTVVVGSLAQSWYAVSGAGLDGPALAGLLARHHAAAYAAGLWWVMVAPAPLLAATLAHRRTPWPWVVVVTVHLVVLVALGVRLRHLLSLGAVAALVATVALGVAAAMAAVGEQARVRR